MLALRTRTACSSLSRTLRADPRLRGYGATRHAGARSARRRRIRNPVSQQDCCARAAPRAGAGVARSLRRQGAAFIVNDDVELADSGRRGRRPSRARRRPRRRSAQAFGSAGDDRRVVLRLADARGDRRCAAAPTTSRSAVFSRRRSSPARCARPCRCWRPQRLRWDVPVVAIGGITAGERAVAHRGRRRRGCGHHRRYSPRRTSSAVSARTGSAASRSLAQDRAECR